MSWPSTFIRTFASVVAAFVALVVAAGSAGAQNIESAIMPGRVIQGHAKLETQCSNCHVRLDRQAQPRLCLDCHKDVAADVRDGSGHHGRLKDRECRRCHTEHKGREARTVILNERSFDHTQTDFALHGKHGAVVCASCHRAGSKHRAAPSQCIDCHRKDDKHNGGLGAKCAGCHNATGWKDTRFDHAGTRFPLLLRHAPVKCADCHVNQKYVNTPKDCLSCHRKDDAHKSHFGARCESCHEPDKWKAPSFRHDTDTRFLLRDKHRTVKCDSCHRKPLYQAKLAVNCLSCHRKDDPHKGSLGEKCESCHHERGWKTSNFDHDRDSHFALRGKHRTAKCDSCHKDSGFREKPPALCNGCHERDDREKGHRGQLGIQCSDCHNERGWRETGFDHARSRFPLRGRHADAKCKQCHQTLAFKDAKSDCLSCHAADDRHKQGLGPRCDNCHEASAWKKTGFDHNQRSHFKLNDAHARAACQACHNAPVTEKIVLAAECASCHARDDYHKQRLGPRCADCHDARGWKGAKFDHNQKSRFKLDGAHMKIGCQSCHTAPVTDRFTLGTDCVTCHGKKDDVHFGSYGAQCERCHVPDNWRKILKRDPPQSQAPTSNSSGRRP